jgi:hypothetical protein
VSYTSLVLPFIEMACYLLGSYSMPEQCAIVANFGPKLASLLQEASVGDENARKSSANLYISDPEQVIQVVYDEAVLRRPGRNHVACVFEELQQAALGRPGSAEAVQGVRSSPTGCHRERGED